MSEPERTGPVADLGEGARGFGPGVGEDPTTAARRAGFEAEALPHLDAVYRFALRLSGSPAAAEDLVQETYLRAWRFWEQYTPGTNSKSWLFTICRNVFLRQQERGKRHDQILREQASGDAGGISREAPVFSDSVGSDPEGEFFRGIVDEEVLRTIDELPEEYRTAVVASDLEGLSYDEIAELMDVPIGTVKSRLFRGRRILQKKLFDYAADMGYVARSRREEE